MNARDELVDLMRSNRIAWATNTEHRESQEAQADAILAAGYRKPRTIASLDVMLKRDIELGEIVRDADGDVFEFTDNGWRCWRYEESFDRFEMSYPATVIHDEAAA